MIIRSGVVDQGHTTTTTTPSLSAFECRRSSNDDVDTMGRRPAHQHRTTTTTTNIMRDGGTTPATKRVDDDGRSSSSSSGSTIFRTSHGSSSDHVVGTGNGNVGNTTSTSNTNSAVSQPQHLKNSPQSVLYPQQQQQQPRPSQPKFLGSQSFGGADPSPLAMRGIPPRADSAQVQRYSASDALSSITYSGYLYKRSNYPHRNPSFASSHDFPQHPHDNHHPFAPILVDPCHGGGIPDLPAMPGTFAAMAAATTTAAAAAAAETGSYRGSNYNSLYNNNDNSKSDTGVVAPSFWPDWTSPLPSISSLDQLPQYSQSQSHSQQQHHRPHPQRTITATTTIFSAPLTSSRIVTPSPANNNNNHPTSAYDTFSKATTGQGGNKNQSGRPKEDRRNPLQQLGDSIAVFFQTHLVGKDEGDNHMTEQRTTDEATESLPTRQEQNMLLLPTPATESTPLLLSTGLSPRTSSRPIKFLTSTQNNSNITAYNNESNEQDETIGHDNRTRRYRGGDTSSSKHQPHTARHRESFLEANHRRYSAPIDMMSNSHSSDLSSTEFSGSLHSGGSSSSPSSSSAFQVPKDFLDPRDGHLWRAKYCVLEEGCLYFYRNKNDGDSDEAAVERKRSLLSSLDDDNALDDTPPIPLSQSFQPRQSMQSRVSSTSLNTSVSSSRRRSSAKDLSKSPMTMGRPILHQFDSSNALAENVPCMWEKRVFMDCVGGVRTAEQQYGLNSFELQALDDEDELNHVDTLVLQAPNQSEMKEWIFQFHRSLASVMVNIMHVFGSTPAASLLNRAAYLDIHHPSMNLNSSHHGRLPESDAAMPHSPSDKHLQRLIAMSPRFYGIQPPTQQPPLSHGHGRYSSRRRRSDFRKPCSPTPGSDDYAGTTSLSSTPETGDTAGSPQHLFAFREPSPGPGYQSAEDGSPPSRFLIPPPVVQSAVIDFNFSGRTESSSMNAGPFPVPDTPERSGPLSTNPETERPKPATGKYVPPHIRKRQQEQEAQMAGTPDYVPPHLRQQQQETVRKKYVPPHLRGSPVNGGHSTPTSELETNSSLAGSNASGLMSLAERAKIAPTTPPPRAEVPSPLTEKKTRVEMWKDQLDVVGPSTAEFIRGGCADPLHVQGSIMDSMFIPKKASRVGKVYADAYGSYGGGPLDDDESRTGRTTKSSLRWETGAVSECGIRESNEDAYLISSDLLSAFELEGLEMQHSWKREDAHHSMGLFAVFDGHCGNQAARFAVERLADFINDELQLMAETIHTNVKSSGAMSPSSIELILRDAMRKLDDDFCQLCQLEGRQWESGATALVAVIANEHLVIGNLGDCRGVLCRSVDRAESYLKDETWSALDTSDDQTSEQVMPTSSSTLPDTNQRGVFWKEVTNVHTPSAEKERARIEKANGWVTTETEIPIGQLRRMDFLDEDVIEILQRCLSFAGETNSSERASNATPSTESDRSVKECKAAPQRILTIGRICGELSVSRALGDRDFKAAFNTLSDITCDAESMEEIMGASERAYPWWDSPLFLPYPDEHNRRFRGDLVSNTPEFQRIKVGEKGVTNEFFVVACDGLWDVMDADDTVRIARDLLYRKKWTAKKAAARLAELAIHLGSSDNVTVLVIRLFSLNQSEEVQKIKN